MQNINFEKDIVNAKENSIETFGVILGWFATIGLHGNNETHTIGNLLSQYASEHKLLEVCTYFIPHPLDNVLLVKLHSVHNCLPQLFLD